MIGSPFLFLPTPTHPARSLDNDVPDAGAAFEFDQRRRMVVQRLDIGRPQVVVSPLRVQHLKQRRFAPVVTVYLTVDDRFGFLQQPRFVTSDLFGQRKVLPQVLLHFGLHLQFGLPVAGFGLLDPVLGRLHGTFV